VGNDEMIEAMAVMVMIDCDDGFVVRDKGKVSRSGSVGLSFGQGPMGESGEAGDEFLRAWISTRAAVLAALVEEVWGWPL
jgi:hypothetical protein